MINRAYQVLSESVDHVEYLIGYEGNAFAFTGDVEQDLLSITAVHPMREDAVDAFLARAEADWTAVHQLVVQDRLVEAEYEGHRFYLRRLGGRQDRG
jgi:wyosine [tRNA(Phe)-imidazoG37] synthetase (radical SAM superfamily)